MNMIPINMNDPRLQRARQRYLRAGPETRALIDSSAGMPWAAGRAAASYLDAVRTGGAQQRHAAAMSDRRQAFDRSVALQEDQMAYNRDRGRLALIPQVGGALLAAHNAVGRVNDARDEAAETRAWREHMLGLMGG